jgi:hypothetical protein
MIRKRNHKNSDLECHERIPKLSEFESNTDEISLKISKRTSKALSKITSSPSFGKENNPKTTLGFSRCDLIQNDRISITHMDTPKQLKNCFSPFKSKGSELNANLNSEHNVEEDEIVQTPPQDRFRNFWLSNLESTHWKSFKYSKYRSTPLGKEGIRPFIRGTPAINIQDQYDNDSLMNGSNFVSPHKELSFGKSMINASPVTRTPLLKQCYGTPCQPSELLDDDPTKAEFSNMLSNKSNLYGNV